VTTISQIISEELIVLELKGRKKRQIIDELASHVAEEIELKTRELSKKILEREKMASTGIGHGVAIPHVLIEGLDRTRMVFGRSESGVPFEAADKAPVHLFFLIVGPKSASAEHLKLLSKLSRMVTNREFRRKLREADNPKEVMEIFRAEEGE